VRVEGEEEKEEKVGWGKEEGKEEEAEASGWEVEEGVREEGEAEPAETKGGSSSSTSRPAPGRSRALELAPATRFRIA